MASVLNGYPQARATVVGYSDLTGPALYNQNLSERRAQAVVDKLIEMDVTPTQLEWRGEGVSFLVANNQIAEGRARNRRVEISIPSFKY
ncbi:MAG: OmpA family protein [Pseudomonadota bacterium]|uniref:OmpA family protein n=1 Tax=Vibrio campbellii TaxID=680 RepID=UPI00314E1C49